MLEIQFVLSVNKNNNDFKANPSFSKVSSVHDFSQLTYFAILYVYFLFGLEQWGGT